MISQCCPSVRAPSSPNRIQGRNITVFNILSIPKIWFSFLTFIVATLCNGFLSINLEPKVCCARRRESISGI